MLALRQSQGRPGPCPVVPAVLRDGMEQTHPVSRVSGQVWV